MFISWFRETKLVPSLGYSIRDMMISLNEPEAGSKVIDLNLRSAARWTGK
ncbi:MAG: hypothetical protein LBT14_01425 [Treponema sp.]|jgi:hypothetical protein|nr:hypothetical protein [Treponema sp.]